MVWRQVNRAHRAAAQLADRHYSRQSPGSRQFTPPGRVLVLSAPGAVWATSWPFPQFVHRRLYPDAWVCSLFRNESDHLSSDLIRQAVAATRDFFGESPHDGMVTMIDPAKVRSPNPGYCFRCAGFAHRRGDWTDGGLIVLRLTPSDMPAAEPALGRQLLLDLRGAA